MLPNSLAPALRRPPTSTSYLAHETLLPSSTLTQVRGRGLQYALRCGGNDEWGEDCPDKKPESDEGMEFGMRSD